ncbi:unnamed protein product [Urochloa humidicola]
MRESPTAGGRSFLWPSRHRTSRASGTAPRRRRHPAPHHLTSSLRSRVAPMSLAAGRASAQASPAASPALTRLATTTAACLGWAKGGRGEAASGRRARAKPRRACDGEERRNGEEGEE